MLGRMGAAMRMALFGGGALAGPIAGVLATWLGLHTALWTLGHRVGRDGAPGAAVPGRPAEEMPAGPDATVTA